MAHLIFFRPCSFFKVGLIDEVLAPASTNKRPVPEWQCHTAKAKSSASTQLTCVLTKGLSVDPAVFLFGWLAWGRPSASRSSPVVCFSGKQGDWRYADRIVQNVGS